MLFTVDTKDFRAALQTAGRVIPAKATWPILTNVKLITNDNRVTVVGSNGDMTFEADVAANVETEGAALVPFDTLSKFTGAAKAETIKITVDGHKARASASRSRIDLSASSVDDYPNFRPPEGEPVTLDRETFVTALRFCASATEEDETRYNMAGPNLSERPEGVTIFGTEGKAMHRAVLSGVPAIGGGGTLPLAAALVILAVADKAEDVAFMISERGWHLATRGIRVWGKVIDAPYPDVDKIINGFPAWDELAVAPKDDFAGAFSIATCGAEAGSDKARNLIIRSVQGEPIVVRGHKAAGGVLHAGRAEMSAEGRGDFAGAINAKYLTNALGGMKADEVCLLTAARDDGSKVISLRPAQQSATVDLSALIMSLRVSEAELADV